MIHRHPSSSRLIFQRQRSQRGATLVVAIFALVALLGCTALALDVGLVMMAASQVQAVADSAALAAAGGRIIGQEDAAQSRIQDIINANQSSSIPLTWNAAELVVYGAGDTVPSYGPLESSQEAVTVTVRSTVNYSFGRVLGHTSTLVERQATALRTATNAGSNTLMFAINSGSNTLGIDLSGSRGLFDGLVHSNTKVDITGSNHHFTGLLEWCNRLRITGSGTRLDQGDAESTIQPDPVGLTPADLGPYDYVINGNYQVPSSGVVPPGCYRVHGNVRVTGSRQRLENVTFVADGTISFSGSNHYYTPNRMGVFAYSLSTSNSAVDISGSAPNSEGLLYAPNGGADFSGSDFAMVSIVAQTIDISGSDFHISPCTKWGSPTYQVRLIN